MDGVSCVGSETSLIECSHISNHNCGHNEDVSVQCQTSKNMTAKIIIIIQGVSLRSLTPLACMCLKHH